MRLSRRELFKAMAAGATIVAGEIWIPKLISIPDVPRAWLHGLTMEPQLNGYIISLNFVNRRFSHELMLHYTTECCGTFIEKQKIINSNDPLPYPLESKLTKKGLLIEQVPDNIVVQSMKL